jgi:Pyruvate/2-oxoacid:ferredoxin oxidoreductase delta subunit
MPIEFSDISVKLIKSTFKNRFTLARLCKKIPPLTFIVDKLFFDGDDILVLARDNAVKVPKGIEIQIDGEIESEDTVLPSIVLKDMIKKSKYHFIMNQCICRVSNHCQEYPQNLGCLFLGQGTKRISAKLGKEVSAQEAIEHVERCQKAGLVHIIGRNKIDSVWLNTGPKDELLSICHCCQCCCLWKMTPELPDKLGGSIKPMLGAELNFNEDLCTSCGKCVLDICFMDAIQISDKTPIIDFDKCRCCGRCAETCSNKAISINIKQDSVKRSIEHVEPLVDLETE